MSTFLSSSPTSVKGILSMMPEGGDGSDKDYFLGDTLTLNEFVDVLPATIQKRQASRGAIDPLKESTQAEVDNDPVGQLFSRLRLDKEEWERFSFFDSSRNYTRNLVATDGETFTLLLLCWNPGKESPIHDHPCDGCWMHVCEGSIEENRYSNEDGTDRLQCYSDKTYQEGQLAFIEDSMGYHKVGNPSGTVPAVTMHLYSPPFQACKVWLDPEHASRPSRSCVCYHSEYGKKH